MSIHDLWVTNGREGIGGGGALYFDSSVTLTGTTSVRGNTSSSAGGIYNDGRLVIRDHVSIVGNRARGWDGGGGVANQGILVIRGAARISRNRAAYWGGAITEGVWGSLTSNPRLGLRLPQRGGRIGRRPARDRVGTS